MTVGASIPDAPWPGLARAVEEDQDGVLAVLQIADELGLDSQELAWVIERESRWLPDAINPHSRAAGLIQWMPATQRALGMPDPTTLSRAEQAPWVAKYLRGVGRPIPRGDLYLAVFFPRAVGAPGAHIISAPGSQVWRANPGLREPGEGAITAGSVRRAGTPPGARRAARRPVAAAGGGLLWLAALYLILRSCKL